MNKITPFLLDLDDERLWHGSLEVPLSPKEFLLLRLFVQRADRLVKKEEILNEIWPNTCITEGLIKDYVRHLRRALGDDPKHPRFIETVHRRGYRFIGRITVVQDKRSAASWPITMGDAYHATEETT